MTATFAFVVILVALALVFDYINGFHDAANSIATVVSTRVLSPAIAVVWAAEGRDSSVLTRFFDELGPERTALLEAISADMGAGYAKAIADRVEAGALTARVCIDPFHVVKLANEAIDACRRWAWNEARRSGDESIFCE